MSIVQAILVLMIIILVMETIATWLFFQLYRLLHEIEGETFILARAIRNADTYKGVFERLVLLVLLTQNVQGALTFYAALKIGTRIVNEEVDRPSRDVFLMGNLLSVLITTGYFTMFDCLLR